MQLLINGHIQTLDPIHPYAEAILIQNGYILEVGTTYQLISKFGAIAQVEDLDQKFILPGLTDAHVHLQHYALSLQKVDCETSSLKECLDRLRARAQETPPGNWVTGHGWQQNDWEDCEGGVDGFPTAQMLDEISKSHPIYLTAKSLHASWANTAALNAARLNNDSKDPTDGALQRDPAGNLTGILLEGAMRLVSSAVPPNSQSDIKDAIDRAQNHLWGMGLTGLHDFDGRTCFQSLQQLHQEQKLKLRIIKNIPVADLDSAIGVGLQSGFGDDRLRIGNVKAFADGALGPHTAAMVQAYEDDPDNTGMLLLDREALFEYGRKAVQNGLAMTVHAIGDLANHEVLEAYSALRDFEKRNSLPKYRHRIEHVQLLHPQDLNRLSDLEVIASMQPIHAVSDMFAADKYWGDRTQYAYAWRTILNAGTNMAFGSDAPVESPNPFWGLHAAVTRTRPGNIPNINGWHPEQKLSRIESILGFTSGAAYAGGMENRLGKLSPGFLADLIVLEKDYFNCEADEIRTLAPNRTMIGGEWVFVR